MRRTALVALALVSAAATVRAVPPPTLRVDTQHRIVLGRLPAILGLEAVSRQLESGLTTIFVFRAASGSREVGAARVDVRYDLWDEVFEVLAVGFDGQGDRQTLDGRAALTAWWSTLELSVVDLSTLPGDQPEELRLSLEVVPFSASEQDDAQRWFTRSFGATTGSDGAGVTDAAERRGDSLEKVLAVLMATSIRGSVLYSARWTVAVPNRR